MFIFFISSHKFQQCCFLVSFFFYDKPESDEIGFMWIIIISYVLLFYPFYITKYKWKMCHSLLYSHFEQSKCKFRVIVQAVFSSKLTFSSSSCPYVMVAFGIHHCDTSVTVLCKHAECRSIAKLQASVCTSTKEHDMNHESFRRNGCRFALPLLYACDTSVSRVFITGGGWRCTSANGWVVNNSSNT